MRKIKVLTRGLKRKKRVQHRQQINNQRGRVKNKREEKINGWCQSCGHAVCPVQIQLQKKMVLTVVYSWWYTVMSHWHSSALGCCIHEGIEATEKYYVTENVASVVSCLISAWKGKIRLGRPAQTPAPPWTRSVLAVCQYLKIWREVCLALPNQSTMIKE